LEAGLVKTKTLKLNTYFIRNPHLVKQRGQQMRLPDAAEV